MQPWSASLSLLPWPEPSQAAATNPCGKGQVPCPTTAPLHRMPWHGGGNKLLPSTQSCPSTASCAATTLGSPVQPWQLCRNRSCGARSSPSSWGLLGAPQLTRTLFWGWQAAAQPCPASAHCPPTARRWGRTPSQHAGGSGGSRVLVTQRTMREAPEAPRVAGLLQRKREESVTHGTVPGACSHPHAHCWHGTPAHTHPVTAHAAPRTPTIAHTHTLAQHTWCRSHPPAGRAHSAPLAHTLRHTHPRLHAHEVPTGTHPRGTHRHTPPGTHPRARSCGRV